MPGEVLYDCTNSLYQYIPVVSFYSGVEAILVFFRKISRWEKFPLE